MATENIQRGLAAYWGALAIVDPLRFEIWGKSRITLPLLRVLVQLRDSPGSSTGEIANHLGVTPSAVTGLIDRLVDLKLVRREPHAHDRRMSCNFLEVAGQRALGDAADLGNAFVGEILDEFSEAELAALTDSFEGFSAAAGRVRSRHEPISRYAGATR